MAEEKETEVVGLDDPQAPRPVAAGIRKYLLPAGVAAGIFAVSLVVSSMLTGQKSSPGEEPVVATADSGSEENTAPVDSAMTGEIVIDTAEIMKELAFLDYNPDAPSDTGEGGKRDSTDSLTVIQKALTQMALEKDSLDILKKDLETREYNVKQGLLKIGQAESSRIISLARLYDGMRAEEVGKLFENLDDSVVVAILPRMKPVNAAKILAIMPPKRAAAISTQLISVAEK